MPFKVTIFWAQQTSKLGGWTENYWNTLAGFTDVAPKASQLALSWFNYKGNPTYYQDIRLTDVDNFRNTRLMGVSSNPATVTDATDADYPTTRGLLLLASANTPPGRTRQWVGGLRDRDVTNSGRWNPVPASVSLINAIVAQLTSPGNGWAVRVLNPANALVDIININGTTGIVTTAPSPVLSGQRVRIKGVRGMTVANGIWKVDKLTDGSYQLRGWVPTTLPFLAGNPTMRLQSYVYQSIASATIVRTTSHRVGKPTALLGGRRRKRAS
jgi:hypothetical protein